MIVQRSRVSYKVVSGNILSEIMDRLNLWHYEDEDEDDREEGSFSWGNGMEKSKGGFLLNIVTYKPQIIGDVQEICGRSLDGDAVIPFSEQADGKDEERIVDSLPGAIYNQKGNIQKISNHIYAISPEDMGLSEK